MFKALELSAGAPKASMEIPLFVATTILVTLHPVEPTLSAQIKMAGLSADAGRTSVRHPSFWIYLTFV